MMMDYARQRAIQILRDCHKVVMATSGPAGLRAGEFLCEAVDLVLYLLLPQSSDHLFNLEENSAVTLLGADWELKGTAHILSPAGDIPDLGLMREHAAEWCVLVRIDPLQLQVRKEEGWGNKETIDLGANL